MGASIGPQLDGRRGSSWSPGLPDGLQLDGTQGEYDLDVTAVWVGALATLTGVLLGGLVSLGLSRQQIRAARQQMQERAIQEETQRTIERRLQAYSDFLGRTRSFRNVVRSYCNSTTNRPTLAEIEERLQAANDASALVFLLVQSTDTYDACRTLLRAMGTTQGVLNKVHSAAASTSWPELKEHTWIEYAQFSKRR